MFGVVLLAVIAIPVWLEFRMGGISNFGFSVQRIVYGTSIEGKPNKQEVEARIIDIFSHDNISEGEIITTSSAFFDQCVLVRIVTRIKTTCPDVSFDRSERRIDLRFLRTNPYYATVGSLPVDPRDEALQAVVGYEFEPEVSDRLHKMNVLSDAISSEEIQRYRKDVDARLIRIYERTRTELTDKIYKDASDITYFCSGPRIVSPDGWWRHDFIVKASIMEEFVDLLHLYRTSYCAE